MAKLTDLQLMSAKKIYDAVIDFLDRFDQTYGFCYLCRDGVRSEEEAESKNEDEADRMIDAIHLLLDKEYFFLHGTEILKEYTSFIEDELPSIYRGKCSVTFRSGEEKNGGNTVDSDYTKALVRINGIIEKYIG